MSRRASLPDETRDKTRSIYLHPRFSKARPALDFPPINKASLSLFGEDHLYHQTRFKRDLDHIKLMRRSVLHVSRPGQFCTRIPWRNRICLNRRQTTRKPRITYCLASATDIVHRLHSSKSSDRDNCRILISLWISSTARSLTATMIRSQKSERHEKRLMKMQLTAQAACQR